MIIFCEGFRIYLRQTTFLVSMDLTIKFGKKIYLNVIRGKTHSLLHVGGGGISKFGFQVREF